MFRPVLATPQYWDSCWARTLATVAAVAIASAVTTTVCRCGSITSCLAFLSRPLRPGIQGWGEVGVLSRGSDCTTRGRSCEPSQGEDGLAWSKGTELYLCCAVRLLGPVGTVAAGTARLCYTPQNPNDGGDVPLAADIVISNFSSSFET